MRKSYTIGRKNLPREGSLGPILYRGWIGSFPLGSQACQSMKVILNYYGLICICPFRLGVHLEPSLFLRFYSALLS